MPLTARQSCWGSSGKKYGSEIDNRSAPIRGLAPATKVIRVQPIKTAIVALQRDQLPAAGAVDVCPIDSAAARLHHRFAHHRRPQIVDRSPAVDLLHTSPVDVVFVAARAPACPLEMAGLSVA